MLQGSLSKTWFRCGFYSWGTELFSKCKYLQPPVLLAVLFLSWNQYVHVLTLHSVLRKYRKSTSVMPCSILEWLLLRLHLPSELVYNLSNSFNYPIISSFRLITVGSTVDDLKDIYRRLLIKYPQSRNEDQGNIKSFSFHTTQLSPHLVRTPDIPHLPQKCSMNHHEPINHHSHNHHN